LRPHLFRRTTESAGGGLPREEPTWVYRDPPALPSPDDSLTYSSSSEPEPRAGRRPSDIYESPILSRSQRSHAHIHTSTRTTCRRFRQERGEDESRRQGTHLESPADTGKPKVDNSYTSHITHHTADQKQPSRRQAYAPYVPLRV
jgi:hypothetical protein